MNLGLRRQRHVQALELELVADPLDHEIDDLDHLWLRKFVEDHDLVDPVEELRPEVSLQCFVDLGLHALIRHGFGVLGEAHRGLAQV